VLLGFVRFQLFNALHTQGSWCQPKLPCGAARGASICQCTATDTPSMRSEQSTLSLSCIRRVRLSPHGMIACWLVYLYLYLYLTPMLRLFASCGSCGGSLRPAYAVPPLHSGAGRKNGYTKYPGQHEGIVARGGSSTVAAASPNRLRLPQ
jgi:hypothetical protein